MKKIIILLFALILFGAQLSIAQGPSFAWAKQLSGSIVGANSTAFCVATDAAGNVFSAGRFSGTVDFNPGSGTTNLTAIGFHDIFISKLDANGNLLWVRAIGSTGGEEARSMGLDASGSVYVTGIFNNTADFDGGPGVQNLSPTGGGPNNQEVFIVKLDTDGNYQWAKNVGAAGSSSNESGDGIAVTKAGDVFVTGYFTNTVDFDPGGGVNNLTAIGAADAYVLSLDTDGNFTWARVFAGPFTSYGISIAVDPSGNIYTGGVLTGTVDFDPGAGTTDLTSAGFEDFFIVKLNSGGNLVWAKTMGGVTQDYPHAITADDAGNVLFTGTFLGISDFDPGAGTINLTSAGGGDIFVGKLDTNGNSSWAFRIGSTNTDIGEAIATDATGNVYVTGGFYGKPDFDPGTGVFELLTAGETDIFILKMDPSGNFMWAGSMGYISSEDDTGYGIDVSSTGDIYSVGNFVGTTDFDPGSCIFNLASPLRSAYVHKLNPSSTGAAHTITSFVPTSGPVGTTVVITGTNFDLTPSNNIVEFNGTLATVTASTSTTITTTVPAGTSSGSIKITIGCDEVTSATNFTVTSAGSISFTTQPSNRNICAGSNTTFSVAATGDTGLQYQWQINNSGFTALSNNATYSGVNTATLAITNAGVALNGSIYRCMVSGDDSSDTPSTSATLTVNATPAAPAINPSNLGCGPASTTLSPTGAGGGEQYKFYDAAIDGDLLGSGITHATGSLSSTTIFYVSIYNTTSLCESSRAPVTITVLSCNPPVVEPNQVVTMIEGIATINLSDIISDPDDNLDLSTLEITQQPSSGATATLDQMIITLDYAGLPDVVSDNLRIRVCDLTSICTESDLAIELTGELVVYNGISINDDARNDTWQIVNIDLFIATKNNKVTVFNRWGDAVFSATNYDNEVKVFKGLSNSGGELPSGTYYYKIEFNSGLKTKTGYLVLKR